MAKRTMWKIAAAVLAVVIAGIVYCVFFSEEEDGVVQYQTGEEAAGDVDDMFVNDTGSNGAQAGSSEVQDFVMGQNDAAQISGDGQKQSLAGGNVHHGGAVENSGMADEDVQSSGAKLVYVHVCGAVNKPAVYPLPEGSRVCDAIAKAGGMTENAAGDYVNQARFLSDGERVYIPEVDELSGLSASQYAAGQLVSNAGGQSGSSAQNGGQEKLLVNINTAGISELTTLPGIGESRAESIIAYREKHGAFAQIEDIMKISGIKGAAYEKIKDCICTGNE